MEWHTLPEADAFAQLQSSPAGLAEDEAARRLEKLGPNELRQEKKISPLKLFLAQFRNFLILILIAATVFSFAIGEAVDGAVILVIVILNAVFGFVQEYRADKAIESLKKLTSPEAVVLRGGEMKKLPSRLLVPGDIVLLDEGSKIPADLRLLEAVNLKIDEASLTGESEPVTKKPGVLAKAELADRVNMAYTGTHVTYGRGRGVVVATAMETEIGKIAHLIQETEVEATPLQKRLAVFSRYLGYLILAISVIVIIGGFLRGHELFDMILTGVALAVAAIPEGLPAIVTITLALGLQRLSKEHALIRRLPAVETLGSTSVICSDKTGTLTKNEMTVRKAWIAGRLLDITGTGYATVGTFNYNGKALDRTFPGLAPLIRTATLCNNAVLAPSGMIGDPTEGALLVAAAKLGDLETFPRVEEVPFSSERKMMSTVHTVGGKRVLFAKGAPEVILSRCTKALADGKEIALDEKQRQTILAANQDLADQALRVLGFATREIAGPANETNLVFLGLIGMIDPARESVEGDIALCRQAGIRVVMITGDHRHTAVAIAKDIGLYRDGDDILTGEELDGLDEAAFQARVEKVAVYARVNPSHKARIVDALKKNRHVVAMTGDGVNDAPALKKADIGIAMGIKGTDVAKEASQMVLTDDNFSSIVSAVRTGRGIYDNINKFIRFLLSSNIAEVLTVFLALLLSAAGGEPLLPLLAVHLLWINLITDGLPALALGVDPGAKDIMTRKPRPLTEKLLSREAFVFILGVGAIITAGTLWVFWSELPNGLEKAQTMAFTTIVLFELFNVFNVRGLFLKGGLGLLSNKKLLLAVAVSFGLQLAVLEIPTLQALFSTTSLTSADWLKIVATSVTVLLWEPVVRIATGPPRRPAATGH
ncbi:MAG: cation-translocating P-type ATPase [Candidatus Aenigmarchaeota archaeon]|nr:cation-translocating P-type ATPase [Candidatus Aenigmarchaeota archaeon]